jgi:hypothetical protein
MPSPRGPVCVIFFLRKTSNNNLIDQNGSGARHFPPSLTVYSWKWVFKTKFVVAKYPLLGEERSAFPFCLTSRTAF